MRAFIEIVRPWTSIGLVLLIVVVITNLGGSTVLAPIIPPQRRHDWLERILITTALASSIGFLCFMFVVFGLYISSGIVKLG
jgi:hypothetical protein